MSSSLLAVLILAPTVAVVAAMFIVMWLERTSTRDAWIAVVGGVFLAAWTAVSVVLSARNVFLQPDVRTTPPVGIALIVTLAALTVFLVASRSLRGLLSNQKNLIRLNMWRLVGAVFLLLMFNGQVPALWAWPAGVGDIIVGERRRGWRAGSMHQVVDAARSSSTCSAWRISSWPSALASRQIPGQYSSSTRHRQRHS